MFIGAKERQQRPYGPPDALDLGHHQQFSSMLAIVQQLSVNNRKKSGITYCIFPIFGFSVIISKTAYKEYFAYTGCNEKVVY